MGFKVKFWGVRGLLPVSPQPASIVNEIRTHFYQFFSQGYSQLKDVDLFLGQHKVTSIGGYGSASTCVELVSPNSTIIIDAGSGIKKLGDQIMRAMASGASPRVFHIVLTHFHFDHLIGLPFFTPIFVPGCEVHIYAVQDNLAEAIKMLFQRPYFPVDFSSLGSKIVLHKLPPRQTTKIGDFELTPYLLDHVDPTWGFKISHQNKTYSHCSDTESTRMNNEDLGDDLSLYKGVDLMYYDAQIPIAKTTDFTWGGHSSPQIGLDLAMNMGIKRVLFGHHDPDATTQSIQNLEQETQSYYISKLESAHSLNQSIHPVLWSFVYEGQVIDL